MGEHDTLEALGVSGEWIWGNDLEMIVFAQAFGYGKTLIFRFTLESEQQSQSLATRIVNCYHDRTIESTNATFPNRPSMRTAIWSAIAAVWIECCEQSAVKDPDVIIDVYDTESADLPSRITWRICHDDIFNEFVDLLLPPSQLLVKRKMDMVDFTSLTRLEQLGGRGCSTLVHTVSDPRSQFVFKGIDFRTFLFFYESGHIQEEVKIYYRSVELVDNMPPHPNIMGPARSLVTISANLEMIGGLCVALSMLSSPMETLVVISRGTTIPVSEYHCRARPYGAIKWLQPLRIPTLLRTPTTWTLSLETSSSTQISILCLLIGSKAMPLSPQQPQRLMALGT